MKQRLLFTEDHVTRLHGENDQLRAEILRLRTSSDAVERAVADQLLLAPEGTTIYRFD